VHRYRLDDFKPYIFRTNDYGKSWQSFQLNLPVVQIVDMVIKEKDLVLATHGRSFWILDDLTPLHQITEEVAKADFFLFKPHDAYRIGGGLRRGMIWGGKNPPNGVVVYYNLIKVPEEEVKLEFLESDGNVIHTFSSKEDEKVAVKGRHESFCLGSSLSQS